MMETTTRTQHTLRKIWYFIAITLSALVLAISALGALGVWIVERPLVETTQNLLVATDKAAGGLRQAMAQIDQENARLRQISGAISGVSNQISQNVEDKGLLATLLPAEQEQALNDTIAKIQATLGNVREFLAAGLSMYHSLNRLPFVDLPGLSEEKADEIVQSVADIQAAIDDLRQSVADFRSGVAQGVNRITQAADRMTQGLDNLGARLAEVDQALAAWQDLTRRLYEAVPLAFGLVAVVLSILMAYVAYTQVEIIRLLVRRWKALSPSAVSTAPVSPLAVEESLVDQPEQFSAAVEESLAGDPEGSTAPEPPAVAGEISDPNQGLV